MTQLEGHRGRAGVTLNLKHDPRLGGWGKSLSARVTACVKICENDDLEEQELHLSRVRQGKNRDEVVRESRSLLGHTKESGLLVGHFRQAAEAAGGRSSSCC